MAAEIFLLAAIVTMRCQLNRIGILRRSPVKSYLCLSLTLYAMSIFGGVMNDSVRILNGGKMAATVQSESGVQKDGAHALAVSSTKLLYAGDIIAVDDSRILRFLFPASDRTSIGDLLMALPFIVMWWVVLAMFLWIFILFLKETCVL